MPTKVFVDTNILIYAVDQGASVRRQRAQQCLARLSDAGGGVASTQVLQEFFSVATRKLRVPSPTAKAMLASLSWLETVLIDIAVINEAADLTILQPLNFWDALLLAAAAKAHCAELWTENLTPGFAYRGVTVVNPLLD